MGHMDEWKEFLKMRQRKLNHAFNLNSKKIGHYFATLPE